MAALHGHVNRLLTRLNSDTDLKNPDYIFLPIYLEHKPAQKGLRRQYCYYTQYACGLATNAGNKVSSSRLFRPLVHYLYNRFHTVAQLYGMLKSISVQGFFVLWCITCTTVFTPSPSFMGC
jgi:hypothetical protein